MIEALIRTIHLIGALAVAISVLLVVLASRRTLARDDLTGMRRIYLALLVAAALTATAGTALWLWVGKPAAFFSNNPVFHAKLGLFGLLLLMLAWPAWYFYRLDARDTSAAPTVTVSALVLRLQKATLPVLLLIPILAYLMARGIGY